MSSTDSLRPADRAAGPLRPPFRPRRPPRRGRQGVTLVKGDLRGIVCARRLSRATVANSLGVPVAAGRSSVAPAQARQVRS